MYSIAYTTQRSFYQLSESLHYELTYIECNYINTKHEDVKL